MNKIIQTIDSHKSDLFYTLSSVIAPFVGMFSSVVSARYVLPEELGVINRILVVLSYTTFLQFGVYNGLNRNIAYYRAKGMDYKVQSLVDTSFYTTRIISFFLSLIGVGYLLYYLIADPSALKIESSLLLILLLFLQNVNTHYEVTFRSGQEFKTLGNIKLKESAFSLVCLILPMLIGALGYVISYGIRVMFQFLLRKKYTPFIFQSKQSLDSYKDLVYTGFPLMLFGYLWTVFMATDITFLSLFYSDAEVGMYNIATLCTTAIMVIPNAINTLLYPKAATIFGKTGEAKSLRPFCIKALVLFSVVLVPISLLAYKLLPFFVHNFMPNYSDGIKCGQLALLSGICFVYAGPSVVFGTLRRNRFILVLITVLLILLWSVLLMCHYHFPYLQIEDVARIKLLFLIVYSSLAIFASFKYVL